ncbi:MAG: hypothetical protein MUE85_23955 [Microscillaceae bacterium]|jgi:hypothetical protein|nr:hypothetical protein [Microscillaceae bacterium]
MKRLIYCFFIVMGLYGTTQAQTIRRVNNTPGINAPFNTIQAAVTAAQANDIILVEGSTIAYTGDVLIDKPLRFIGPGYFHTQPNPVTQAMPLEARGIDFRLRTGSNGTIIEGFSECAVSNYIANNQNIVAINNITIRRNRNIYIGIADLTAQNDPASSNLLITQNFSLEIVIFRCVSLIISNNRISNGFSGLYATTGSVNNNIIQRDFPVTSRSYNFGNFVVQSNISFFNNIVTNNVSVSGFSTTSNNILVGTQLPATNGNIQNVNMNNVFLTGWNSFPRPANLTDDGLFQLRAPDANNSATNPAKGGGVGGVDCGMFGGLSSYVLSGIPAVPVITKFVTTPAGNNNTPLQVTISIQSNQ